MAKDIKNTDYYRDLYVLNSFETDVAGDKYEVDIWADDVIIKKNGEKILEDNPIMMYKEAEVLMTLAKVEISPSTKIKRKISESAEDWYVELLLYKDEERTATIRRSYHQNDGEKGKADWVESEVIEMPLNIFYELYMLIMNEIKHTDVDF